MVISDTPRHWKNTATTEQELFIFWIIVAAHLQCLLCSKTSRLLIGINHYQTIPDLVIWCVCVSGYMASHCWHL